MGRAQLAQLTSAADEVAAGSGKLIVVDGDEGIGKSRLVEELLWLTDGEPARELQVAQKWTVLVGACHASERGLPYHPFVDLLTAAVAGYGADVVLQPSGLLRSRAWCPISSPRARTCPLQVGSTRSRKRAACSRALRVSSAHCPSRGCW